MLNFRLEVIAYWLVPLVIFCMILLVGLFIAYKFDVFGQWTDEADRLPPYYNASGEIVVPELLDSYLTAVGGREALEGIRSIRYKGRLIEPAAEIKLQILASLPDKGMIITSPGEDDSQKLILNGDRAWQVVRLGDGSQKVVPLSEADTASLAWSLRVHNTFRSLALEEEGGRDGFTAREIEFSDRPCIELTKIMPDGSELIAVLDAKSLYLLQMVEAVPGAEGMERVKADYSAHNTVSGIVHAHETKFYKSGEVFNEVYLDTIEINPGLVSSLFEVPQEF